MNKKIIAIGILSLFLVLNCISLSTSGQIIEAIEQPENTKTMTGSNEFTVFDIQVFNAKNEPVSLVNIHIEYDANPGSGSWYGATNEFGRYYEESPNCQGQVKILFYKLGYCKKLFEYKDVPLGHRFEITLTMERKSSEARSTLKNDEPTGPSTDFWTFGFFKGEFEIQEIISCEKIGNTGIYSNVKITGHCPVTDHHLLDFGVGRWAYKIYGGKDINLTVKLLLRSPELIEGETVDFGFPPPPFVFGRALGIGIKVEVISDL